MSRVHKTIVASINSATPTQSFNSIVRYSAVAVLGMMFLFCANASAQEASEYQVKAAFLYNFAKFVEWPAGGGADAPLVIGVLGKDPFGGEIDRAVEGKTVNGRRLTIKRFSSLEAYEYCHILFVSSSERNKLPQIIAAVRNSSVLTVSETDRFAHIGGIINFVTIENRIRFEINQAAAERAGLKISSKLLSLGRVVRT
jgi:YfiR/HmsC-like